MTPREVLHFDSHDDAVAEVLRDAPDGDIVEIHAEHCQGCEEPCEPYDVVGCTCEPMILIVGATA